MREREREGIGEKKNGREEREVGMIGGERRKGGRKERSKDNGV